MMNSRFVAAITALISRCVVSSVLYFMGLFSNCYSVYFFTVRLQHNATNINMNMLYFHSQ
jgi:hypothetical protein